MDDDLRKPQKRWNAENYKQFNIALRPKLIEAFREACVQNNVAMRAVLVSFMSEYASAPPSSQNQKDKHNFQRRNDRRKSVGLIISQLEAICAAEIQYMENMPENLKNSSRYEAAEHAVDSINDAIELLVDAFDF
jgi:hypothetical protein